MSRTIALLTDFGTADTYVGTMKGVILSIAPGVQIVDISHGVQPQNIDEGAYLLWSSYRFFPHHTILVAIVDPGVGTDRPIVCVRTSKHLFLAPDNGILKFVLAEIGDYEVVRLSNRKYYLPDVSVSFHGRDIFAPVAAHLATGLPVSKLGKCCDLLTQPEWLVKIESQHRATEGRVLHIDRFGNIITNFTPANQLPAIRAVRVFRKAGTSKSKRIQAIRATFYPTYGDAPTNTPFAMIGSSGLLEIALRNGNASSRLKLKAGDHLKVEVVYEEE